MKRATHYFAVLLLLAGSAHAQVNPTSPPAVSSLDDYVETGMEVSGVRAPYYDEEGNLRAQLYGGRARMLGDGMADVTHIRIDVFEEGQKVMTLYAPQCITRVMETGTGSVLSVESEGDVLISMEQMTISGRGFRFNSESNRFEIFSEAKVLVKDSMKNLEGLEL
jgi:hypothetical protein